MNPENIITGLDIGSAKTTAVIGQAMPADAKSAPYLKILGVGQARTTGLRRGIVSDIEETTRSIRKAVEDAERMAGTKVDTLYAGIAGEHVRAMISKGIVAVNGDEISKADVDRANEVARAQPVPQDRELLHAIPQEYSVDKNQGIRDPIGMIGTRLETEMYLVTIGASPAMNLRKSVERAGYHVRELVLEPLASAMSVLTVPALRAIQNGHVMFLASIPAAKFNQLNLKVERFDPSLVERLRREEITREEYLEQQGYQRHRAGNRCHASRRRAPEGTLRVRLRAARQSAGHNPTAEYRRAGRTTRSARGPGPHHSSADGRDLQPGAG